MSANVKQEQQQALGQPQANTGSKELVFAVQPDENFDEEAFLDMAAHAVLDAINQRRAQEGLPPLPEE
jgi:hypothetical protein